jgi:galactose mutarotase-like enzyme
LWQNPDPKHARPRYADGYEKGEFAGFDEMFPTISKCFCEVEPWAGTELPDHGEVWCVPWTWTIEGRSAEFTVEGVRFPYTLTKRVTLEGGVFRAEYTLVNRSEFPFPCIWAAHPLFNCEEGSEFVVPDGMDRIVNSVESRTLGPYGAEYGFPRAETPSGRVDLGKVPPRNDRGYQKYYFKDPVTEGWCLLHHPARDLSVGMSYPAAKVRYLGMWLNEGGLAGQYNIAPEPATAAMDRTDAAALWGMDSILGPRETWRWYLNICVAEGRRGRRVDERGVIE